MESTVETTVEVNIESPVTPPLCVGCSVQLEMPYIKCVDCFLLRTDICQHCFARGLETNTHRSDHRYQVMRNDFPLFEPTWTAEEELRLLDAITDCGIGNWVNIAKQVQTKTRVDCERHYNAIYLERTVPELPEMHEAALICQPSPVVFKLCDDPPRPANGSTAQRDMAGYMAARGDFAVEFDNFAEMNLRDLNFEIGYDDDEDRDSHFYYELKLAVLDIYRHVLKERQRRKRIIRKYGLINITKMNARPQMSDSFLRMPMQDSLKALQRLFPRIEFDKFVASLCYENGLRQKISRLKEYRMNGITDIHLASIYDKLKARRVAEIHKRHLLTDAINSYELASACQAAYTHMDEGGRILGPVRKSAPPLNIVSLPGYDRLSEIEKQLCSEVRLVPEAFMEFKRLLIAECQKLGSLRLAQARPLIKIDVNKTRKIYNYLLAHGHIHNSPVT